MPIIRAILIILFCASISQAAMLQGIVAGTTATGGGGGNNTVDMSRGFEVDSDPSGWAETDTGSKLNRYDTAQAHSGTHSMSVIVDADAVVAYQRYDMGAVKANLSFAFWHYAPAGAPGTQSSVIATVGAATPGTNSLRLYYDYTNVGTAYHYRIRGTTFPAGVTALTTGQWYRLEVVYVQNGTSTLTVYNSAGTQIDTVSVTAANNNSQYIFFGVPESTGTARWNAMYFDDIGLDFTDSTSPLWPYTVGN